MDIALLLVVLEIMFIINLENHNLFLISMLNLGVSSSSFMKGMTQLLLLQSELLVLLILTLKLKHLQ